MKLRLIGAFLIIACAASLAATVLVNDDFNGLATGSQPEGYLIEETGGKVSIVEVPGAKDKSLFLDDPGSNNIKITKKFAPQTGVVTAELSFMQTKFGTTAKVIRLMDADGANVAVHLETRSGNFISWKDKDGMYNEVTEYAEKVWIDIKVVANVKTQTADIFVNGKQKAAQIPFLAAVANIGSFDSYTPGSSAKGHYLDNIKISAE